MSLHSTFKKISPTTLLKQEDWEGLCLYFSQHPEKVRDSAGNEQNIILSLSRVCVKMKQMSG